MVLADIPEILEDLRRGELLFSQVDSALVWMIGDYEVQEIYDALPEELRLRFRDVLCETFGKHGPPQQILLLNSATGDHPEKLKVVDRARSWLQAKGLMSYGAYRPREQAPRSFQPAGSDFWARHFPPKAVDGSQEELVRRCAALEREAYELAEQRNDLAVPLYQQASALQMLVAERSPEYGEEMRKGEISRTLRLMHAYSLQLSSGDVFQALRLMEQAHGEVASLPNFAEYADQEREAVFYGQRLEHALVKGDWQLANEEAATAWGRTSPELILAPLFQIARRTAMEEEAKDLLRRLVVAYPQNLSYHLLYLSSGYHASRAAELAHAEELSRAFPRNQQIETVLTSLRIEKPQS
jgi:hypothetical protein